MVNIDNWCVKHRTHLSAVRTVLMFLEGRTGLTFIIRFTLLMRRDRVIDNISKNNALIQRLDSGQKSLDF